MNIQKNRVIEDSNNGTNTFSQLNKYLSVRKTKRQDQGSNPIVSERRQGSNQLLFGITVAVLTAIMGSSILFAINQYHPPKTSILSINNLKLLLS
jgi:hypothetical protein